MGDAVAHRGPDEARHHVHPGAFAVAFRRLSIIDVETGSQPLTNEDGSIVIVCNGEICDFARVAVWARKISGMNFGLTLTARSSPIYTKSTGSTLYGISKGCSPLRSGTLETGSAFLFRDHLGVKPLYFANVEDSLLYGSEPRALLASGLVGTDVDSDAIVEYLTLQYVPAPRTGFERVRKLGPGEILTFKQGGVSVQRYWTLAESRSPRMATDMEESLVELDDLLLDATRRRLVADVPVGMFLSGGIDSSLVASYVAQTGENLQTFSVGFDDPGYDESVAASQVASMLGTRHTSITLSPMDVPRVADLISVIGEPFADSSVIPTYAVS